MTAADYRLVVLDAGLNRLGELEEGTQLNLALRFNAPDTWIVDTRGDTPMGQALASRGAGLLVYRGGDLLTGGPLVVPTTTAHDDVLDLNASGASDDIWLERRLALPVPTGPPYSGAAYDVRTGAMETVMRQFVDVNAGPGAVAARRVARLSLAVDQGRGATVTGRARFVVLADLLRSLALSGGDYGFRVRMAPDAPPATTMSRVFEVYQPANLAATVIYSRDIGNLSTYKHAMNAPGATYVYAGGSGQGTSRTFAEQGDSAGIANWGRIEKFIDDRGTGVGAELDQAVGAELDQSSETNAITVDPVDTAALAFGDYGLGDQITVVAEGVAYAAVVRQVNIKVDADGEHVTPLVGDPGARMPQTPTISSDVSAAAEKLANLETVQ